MCIRDRWLVDGCWPVEATDDSTTTMATLMTFVKRRYRLFTPLASALEHRSELLDPLSHIDFAYVHVSPCIDPDGVRERHLTSQPAAAAEVAEGLPALPVDRPDDVVMRVGDEEILLLRVLRHHHLVGGAANRLLEGHGNRHRRRVLHGQAGASASLRR